MRTKTIFIALLTLIAASACTPEPSDICTGPRLFTSATTPTFGTWQGTVTNVSYGANSQQNMDVNLPTVRNGSNLAFIVVHGGAWTEGGGTSADMIHKLNMLKERFPTAAFYNVNYRLKPADLFTNTNLFPTQEEDLEAALQFVIARRAADNVSDKLVIVGYSAGAQLSLLTAYKHNTGNAIKAVAAFAPPTNLYNLQGLGSAAVNLLDPTTFERNGQSPINYITSETPPTIFFHGTEDLTVDYGQSTQLLNALTAQGITKEYYSLKCEGHEFLRANDSVCCNLIQRFVATNVP